MVKVVQGAADLFVDVLHPAGCRVVLLTGGVGRETPPLWGELRARKLTALFGYDEPWARGTLPPHVSLPLQGVEKKPVLSSVELTMPPDELRAYCSEADVFLELFAARCAPNTICEQRTICGALRHSNKSNTVRSLQQGRRSILEFLFDKIHKHI